MTLSCDVGQQQWAAAPSQSHNQESKQLTRWQLFCPQTAVLFLTFRRVFNQLHGISITWGLPRWNSGNESTCQFVKPRRCRPGRSPRGWDGSPLHHTYLENPTDRGVWQATVRGPPRVRHNGAQPHAFSTLL